ncbi:MAG: YicC family protein [Acidobacteria bacterium]|nr:YicC family protein [Acidobacteriota bacterium]
MRSMTGFGRAEGQSDRHAVVVSLRGVNHRYLDLKIRLEEAYISTEGALRRLFGRELLRGRVDARIEVRRLGERRVRVEVQRSVLETLQGELNRLEADGLVAGRLAAADLLRLPEVLRLEPEPETWNDDDEALLLAVARQALAQLVGAREAEGAQLEEFLAGHLTILEGLAEDLEGLREDALTSIRDGLARRLDELLSGTKVEPQRLEAEVALLVDKSDVREEMDRLGAHLGHFRSLLSEPGSLGKRMDFLAQEILRELNTLGAKCRNAAMIQAVLEAKSACEQLREQVQNVE